MFELLKRKSELFKIKRLLKFLVVIAIPPDNYRDYREKPSNS